MRTICVSILILLAIATSCSARLVSLKSRAHKGLPSFDIGSLQSVATQVKTQVESFIKKADVKGLVAGVPDLSKLASNLKVPKGDSISAAVAPLTDAAKQAFNQAQGTKPRI